MAPSDDLIALEPHPYSGNTGTFKFPASLLNIYFLVVNNLEKKGLSLQMYSSAKYKWDHRQDVTASGRHLPKTVSI